MQMITTAAGEQQVLLSRAEYQDLVDARDHATAMANIAAGAATVSEAEMDDYLASPTPLAFWRRKAGLTQAALAERVGVSQPFLAQIETGRRVGAVDVYARLARALELRMEDLVPDAE